MQTSVAQQQTSYRFPVCVPFQSLSRTSNYCANSSKNMPHKEGVQQLIQSATHPSHRFCCASDSLLEVFFPSKVGNTPHSFFSSSFVSVCLSQVSTRRRQCCTSSTTCSTRRTTTPRCTRTCRSGTACRRTPPSPTWPSSTTTPSSSSSRGAT